MVMAIGLIAGLAALWAAGAALLMALRGISFHQAFLFLPLKLLHRITVPSRLALQSTPPVIYAVLHQSRLDPALMLSLLPEDTLHILDERSARSAWLEPWREMARTIAFNPRHVFVSRRLVRHLRGRGRLAVYFPDGIQPNTQAYRLYRAVAKIAAAAEARVVAISVQGSRRTLHSLTPEHRGFGLPRLSVNALEPMTIAELVAASPREAATMAAALYDRVAAADAA
jgi:acyl-[acyl-carrier-protein]-phospholipid O-acyltransferase/long-chain-fatty-acid--[acyl-carrier-protein] ligase